MAIRPPSNGEPAAPESILLKIFLGPNGIRVGWPLLIYFTILFALAFGANAYNSKLQHGAQPDIQSPLPALSVMAVLVSILLVATWMMTKIEGRRFADYGLPWGKAFGKQFWQGATPGFGGLSALMGVLRFTGALSLELG